MSLGAHDMKQRSYDARGVGEFARLVQDAYLLLDQAAHRELLTHQIRAKSVGDRVMLVTDAPDVKDVDVTSYTPWAIARELNSMIREVCA